MRGSGTNEKQIFRYPMPAVTQNIILSLYYRLFELYGEQHWWPCKTNERWEIAAGAILTQNTAWNNVEKALDRLADARITTAGDILRTDRSILCELIRPAGFFTRKSVCLQTFAEFYLQHEQDLQVWPMREARKQLLAQKGIGPETADSILLYAFERPVFVIDAYTRRVATRHLHLDGALPYDALQQIFTAALPHDVRIYNEYHALIVKFCKVSCKKNACGPDCPLQ